MLKTNTAWIKTKRKGTVSIMRAGVNKTQLKTFRDTNSNYVKDLLA